VSRKPAPIKVIKTIFPEEGKVGPNGVYVTQILFMAAERAKSAEATSRTGNISSGADCKLRG